MRALFLCGVAMAVGLSGAAPVADTAVGTSEGNVPTAVPGRQLPIVREHTYRMAGKIRVLLLWVGRDDVGSGVIKWRDNGDRRAFELIIGSDPKRAPSQLNKWGYLVEELHGAESAVVGLISQENDDRLSDVKADLKTRKERRAFDTIRGVVTLDGGVARVGTLHAPSELTYHDAEAVLSEVLGDRSLPIKQVTRVPGVRAGFLSTLNDLMAAVVAGKTPDRRPVHYVHGDRLYQLRVLDTNRLARFERDGARYDHVVRSRFETGEAGGRSGTRFELVYGTAGDLAGIPIVISYQPKWWLQVDLVLHT